MRWRVQQRLGDPALIPWLLPYLSYEEHARFAAAAVALITNADFIGELEGQPPEGL